MSLFSIFQVSGSAVSAQSQRLNVVASNLKIGVFIPTPGKASYLSGDAVARVRLSGQY